VRNSVKRLYLVRHAVAEERGPSWPDDTLRPLTERGQRRFARAAAGFVRLEGVPDSILTSPLVRARQTAELLSSAADDASIDTQPALSPGEPPAALLAKVRALRADRIALVGHEPDLGQLAAVLLGASRPLPFKKGGICRIDVEWQGKAKGTLVWFLPPAALRRLGR
jgi:phosphohistidine phosphatase